MLRVRVDAAAVVDGAVPTYGRRGCILSATSTSGVAGVVCERELERTVIGRLFPTELRLLGLEFRVEDALRDLPHQILQRAVRVGVLQCVLASLEPGLFDPLPAVE